MDDEPLGEKLAKALRAGIFTPTEVWAIITAIMVAHRRKDAKDIKSFGTLNTEQWEKWANDGTFV